MSIKGITKHINTRNAILLFGSYVYASEAYKLGKIKANEGVKVQLAGLTNDYLHTLKNDELSPTQSQAKKAYFEFMLDQDMSEYSGKIGGFFNGLFTSIKRNLVPIGLLIATFATRNKQWAQKMKLNFLLPFAFCAYAFKQFVINPLNIKSMNHFSNH